MMSQQIGDYCISHQAVLDLIKNKYGMFSHPEVISKFINLEEEINDIPPVTPTERIGHWVNDDLISRQVVLDILEKEGHKWGNNYRDWVDAIEEIKKLPPKDRSVQDFVDKCRECGKQKTGHWEWVQYDYNPKLGNWHCSECRSIVVESVYKNEKAGILLYKYCPNCGTKMQKSEEQEN